MPARRWREPLRFGEPTRDPLPGFAENLLPDEQFEMSTADEFLMDVLHGRANQPFGCEQLFWRHQFVVARR